MKCELTRTGEWFKTAMPTPSEKQACIQLGCHIEEQAEMFEALGMSGESGMLHKVADGFKQCLPSTLNFIRNADHVALFDSILDQTVTGTGFSHTMGWNHIGGLAEVNDSNFSKFEDGEAVFDENGKIKKGKQYRGPVLEPHMASLGK
jgi:hypothetical protein